MMNVGSIAVVEQQSLTKMPQEAASAWSAFEGSMVGAAYKPISYVEKQIVKGVNHVFIATNADHCRACSSYRNCND